MPIYCGNSIIFFYDGFKIACEETPPEVHKKILESDSEEISLTISKVTEVETKQFSKNSIKRIYWAD